MLQLPPGTDLSGLFQPQPTLGQDIGGIYDLIRGITGGDISAASGAALKADPFAPERGQYQQQLAALMRDPNSFKTDPGYKFALGQGQEGITRAENALYGTQRTGSLAPDLAKFTEGYASQAYADRINQLMVLSGATTGSPAAAGLATAQGTTNQQASLGGGFKSIGDIVSQILGLTRGGGGGVNWGSPTFPGGVGGGTTIDDIFQQGGVGGSDLAGDFSPSIDDILAGGDIIGPW
jgi:hypothetical protein